MTTTPVRPMTVAMELLPYLRRARDHVDRHYADPLDLGGLAAVAGVSKFHFVRALRAAYGETPIRYLTRRRIERAQDLLRVANLTVTEICMLVGFASLGSFSSRFSLLVGESPAAYRNRWAARGGPHVPGPPLTTEAAAFIRGQLESGQWGGLGLRVDDCRKTYEELSAKGVVFLQEPSDRPYGVEAVMRDDTGSWVVLVEPKDFTPADFA